jgi:hypothetical protein
MRSTPFVLGAAALLCSAAPALAEGARPARLPTGPAWYEDEWGWALMGGGVLSLGVGSGFLVHAADLRRDALDERSRNDLLAVADNRDANAFRTAGAVGVLAGSIAMLGGVVKLAWPAQPTTAKFSTQAAFGFGWVGIDGKF